MKKSILKAFVMALALVLAVSAVAQADTIISPAFRLPGAESRPTETPTVEPTAEPTAAPVTEDEAEPTPEPTEAPVEEPEIILTVTSNLTGRKVVLEGTKLILTLKVEGAEGRDYTIRWQQTKDGVNWEDIPGANGYEYSLTMKVEHSGMYWRACLDMADADTQE